MECVHACIAIFRPLHHAEYTCLSHDDSCHQVYMTKKALPRSAADDIIQVYTSMSKATVFNKVLQIVQFQHGPVRDQSTFPFRPHYA